MNREKDGFGPVPDLDDLEMDVLGRLADSHQLKHMDDGFGLPQPSALDGLEDAVLLQLERADFPVQVQDGFAAPALDELEAQVLKQVQPKTTRIIPLWARYSMSAAAGVAAIFIAVLMLWSEPLAAENQLADLDQELIKDYLMDLDSLDELAITDELDVDAVLDLESDQYDLDVIEDYLYDEYDQDLELDLEQ